MASHLTTAYTTTTSSSSSSSIKHLYFPPRPQASLFFGVARLGVPFFVDSAAAFDALPAGVVFFLDAGAFAAFFADAFVVGTAALVLVTRPDFVLLRTAKSSFGTAGASAALRGLLALAFGFAAAALVSFLGAAALVVFFAAAGVFLVAGALAFC